MLRKNLETRLRVALRNLIVDEYSLFVPSYGNRPASEVAVCAQLARYLAPQLSRTWDVDCEYNRAGTDRPKMGDDKLRHPADLIVHRRTGVGPEHNLLVLELKTTDENGSAGGNPTSLQAVMREHGYRHGVFLHLGYRSADASLAPDWEWFGDTPSHEMGPVFDTNALKAIHTEAEAQWQTRNPHPRPPG